LWQKGEPIKRAGPNSVEKEKKQDLPSCRGGDPRRGTELFHPGESNGKQKSFGEEKKCRRKKRGEVSRKNKKGTNVVIGERRRQRLGKKVLGFLGKDRKKKSTGRYRRGEGIRERQGNSKQRRGGKVGQKREDLMRKETFEKGRGAFVER